MSIPVVTPPQVNPTAVSLEHVAIDGLLSLQTITSSEDKREEPEKRNSPFVLKKKRKAPKSPTDVSPKNRRASKFSSWRRSAPTAPFVNCADSHLSQLYKHVPDEILTEQDADRVRHVLLHGTLPKVQWSKIRRDFAKTLSLYSDSTVRVSMYFCRRVENGALFSLDVDEFMSRSNTDAIIVHGESMVYMATLSEELCSRIYLLVEDQLGLSVSSPSDIVIQGIVDVTACHSPSKPRKGFIPLANFGASVRPQPQGVDAKGAYSHLVGSRRGGRFLFPVNVVVKSIVLPVRAIYDADFRNVIKDPTRTLRLRDMFEQNKGCPLYYPLLSSLPSSSPSPSLAVALWENEVRSVSEYLLERVFVDLPYATTGCLCAHNLKKACSFAESLGKRLPIKDLCRALPKGSVGLSSGRLLHDDGNAALIPGVWTSFAGNENCLLKFQSVDGSFYLRTTKRRFCLFYGWIPHLSEKLPGPVLGPKSSLDGYARVHHSAYSKPLIEFIGLSLFDDNDVMESVMNAFPV
jgi:hypothetical protein